MMTGDANTDSRIDVADIIFLRNYLCSNAPAPNPLQNGDVNGDCVIDANDVNYLLDYLFRGGPDPADCACTYLDKGNCMAPKGRSIEDIIAEYENAGSMLSRTMVIGNHPNPYNPSTEIKFYLPETADVSLEIF